VRSADIERRDLTRILGSMKRDTTEPAVTPRRRPGSISQAEESTVPVRAISESAPSVPVSAALRLRFATIAQKTKRAMGTAPDLSDLPSRIFFRNLDDRAA
jgi:hypothetical protein